MTRRNTTQATSRYRSASPKDGAGMIQPRLWGFFLLMGALMLSGSVGAAERRSGETSVSRSSSTAVRSEATAVRSEATASRRSHNTVADNRLAQANTSRSTRSESADKARAEEQRKAADKAREAAAEQRKAEDRRREAAAQERSASEARKAAQERSAAEDRKAAEQRKTDERRREAAEEQRKAATRQQQAAEQQRRTAEQQRSAAEQQRNAAEQQQKATRSGRQAETAPAQRTNNGNTGNSGNTGTSGNGFRLETGGDRSGTRSQQAVETRNPAGRGVAGTNNGDVRTNDNRGANDNRGTNNAGIANRIQTPDERGRDIRYDGPSRSEVRYYQFATHKTGFRYTHERERCHFCFGVGYTYGHDHLSRLRCPHCMGRGFGIEFHVHLHDVCPICYGAVNGYGFANRHHEMVDIARRMTQELDYVVGLSNSQERRIYRINLDYLRKSRRGDQAYWIERRDNQLYRVLNYRQRPLYLAYARNFDYRDVCDHCFAVYF